MDILFERFFDPEGWEQAIEKAVDKDMKRSELNAICNKENLQRLAIEIYTGKYTITPPHTAKIPKEGKNEFRTVFVNKPLERIVLGRINDLLCELCSDMIHKNSTAYQKDMSCGKVVTDLSRHIRKGETGWKGDLSKYFDSVPRECIDKAFDMVEQRLGHSCIIDIVRKYYHQDEYYDSELKQMVTQYQSLKQGCAVASWLANVVLYDADERISKLDVLYRRYSDDFVIIGNEKDKGMDIMREELAKRGMVLNLEKVEALTPQRWFKFLGFSVKGKDISLSSTRIKKFQRAIDECLRSDKRLTMVQAVGRVMHFLYGNGSRFCWATLVLPTVNVKRDVDMLNAYAMDAIRAAVTGNARIGGLGYIEQQEGGCIMRGKGRNVNANRMKTPARLPGYVSLGCAQSAMRTSMPAYYSLVSMPL